MICFKGVIWLLLATVAEVPPAVSLIPRASPFRSSQYYIVGVRYFEFEW
jgi:hypothetical protein